MAFSYANLPQEVRDLIWDTYNDFTYNNLIKVAFTRQPSVEGSRAPRHRNGNGRHARYPTRVKWNYRCFQHDVPAMLSINHDARERYMSARPNFLQFRRGPRIYFDATRDTVWFDSESLLALWHYVEIWRPQTHEARGNLRGFDQIRNLGSHFPPTVPHPHVYESGLRELRRANTRALTGLRTVTRIGSEGIYPGGRPWRAFQFAHWLEVESELKDVVKAQLTALEADPNLTPFQLGLIDTERHFVDHGYWLYFATNPWPQDLTLQ